MTAEFYRGRYDADAHAIVEYVTVDGVETLPHIVIHSPTGFSWGYGGSGPADLALSLLCHALGIAPIRSPFANAYVDRYGERFERAWAQHQQFKWEVVAQMKDDSWTLARDVVERYAALERANGNG